MESLYNRLTEEERKKINGYMTTLLWIYAGTARPTIAVMYNMFKDIFGDELFGDQLTVEDNTPSFELAVEKLSEEYVEHELPKPDSKFRGFIKEECKSVLTWLNERLTKSLT